MVSVTKVGGMAGLAWKWVERIKVVVSIVSACSMMPHLTKEASRSLTTDEKYMLWRLRLNTSYSTGSS